MKRFLWIPVLALLAGLAVLADPARAHAELVDSNPEINASLDRAPAQVELIFSEALEVSFSTVRVLDSAGNAVDNGDARVDTADPTRLTASLRSLADGVYTVSWKALSAVDGHLTQGAFPFAVGDVDTAALTAVETSAGPTGPSGAEALARWLLYLSVLTLVGGPIFVRGVWQPAFQAVRAEADPPMAISAPWPHLARLGLTGLLLASLLGLLVQAGKAAGAGIAAPWSSATREVLLGTRLGVLWIARIGLAFAVAGWLPRARTRRARWIVLLLTLLLLLSISLGSHAAAEPNPTLPVLADWAHLIAGSAWVGGLLHFGAGLAATRALGAGLRTRLIARLIPRFSALALVSVGLLTLTGTYSAVLRIGTLAALVGSPYGQVLLLKLFLMLPMLALGAFNLLVTTPNMKRGATGPEGNEAWANRFYGLVRSEAALGVALLLSVGLLTSLPPARAVAAAGPHQEAEADHLRVVLDVSPGRVGVNEFTVTLSSHGLPVEDAQEVLLRFAPSRGDVPPSEAALDSLGDGEYVTRGAYLSLPGAWQIQVVVRREGEFDAFANFDLNLGRSTNVATIQWNRIGGGLLLIAAVAYAFALSTLTRTRLQAAALGLVPAFLLVLAVFGAFRAEPANADAGPINPIPPNPESAAIGKGLYEVNCLGCHGPMGKGDGPVGLTLNPRPADLSQHAIPGVHTDGQLHDWITNGFPGSVMPAFKDSLSDEERWHLVNYVRTLAPK